MIYNDKLDREFEQNHRLISNYRLDNDYAVA
jgi:ribosomal protein S17E